MLSKTASLLAIKINYVTQKYEKALKVINDENICVSFKSSMVCVNLVHVLSLHQINLLLENNVSLFG